MANELPEVGSRWTIDGSLFTVAAVKKKGRGHYVTSVEQQDVGKDGIAVFEPGRERLQDFRKKAKAVE